MARNDAAMPIPPGSAAAELLSAMSTEMFEQTGGDKYRAGQPLANDPTALHEAEQKAARSAAKEKPAKSDEEGTTPGTDDNGGELILGKWKTAKEAEKGIHELIQHAKKALERADMSEAKAAELEKKVNALSKAVVADGGDPESDDPFDFLETKSYVPKDKLRQAMEKVIDEKFQEIAKPTLERQKADQEIVEIFPDYAEKYDDILEFLHKHPAVLRDVQYAENKGEFLLARKYAYTLYTAQQAAVKEAVSEEKGKTRAEKVEKQKPDAALLGSTRSDGRIKQNAPEVTLTPDRFEYLKDMAKRGHPDLLWRETIGKMLENDPNFPR